MATKIIDGDLTVTGTITSSGGGGGGGGSGSGLAITALAPAYDPNSTYSEGDIVSYNDAFYKCNVGESGVTGTWDASHWITGTLEGLLNKNPKLLGTITIDDSVVGRTGTIALSDDNTTAETMIDDCHLMYISKSGGTGCDSNTVLEQCASLEEDSNNGSHGIIGACLTFSATENIAQPLMGIQVLDLPPSAMAAITTWLQSANTSIDLGDLDNGFMFTTLPLCLKCHMDPNTPSSSITVMLPSLGWDVDANFDPTAVSWGYINIASTWRVKVIYQIVSGSHGKFVMKKEAI